MSLTFQGNGNLVEGIHVMTLEEFEIEFGSNYHRNKIIGGLKIGMAELKDCGCKKIYIDGSFVTKKEYPGDFDACWDESGVDLLRLKSEYGTIINFDNHRKAQKERYFGEFFPMSFPADEHMLFLYFFQKDRDGNKKGIVQIDLN